ncbi:MAG: hypothetical protein AB7O62_00245 [Pirellulales bacterium]
MKTLLVLLTALTTALESAERNRLGHWLLTAIVLTIVAIAWRFILCGG